jgi:hypothetical protein
MQRQKTTKEKTLTTIPNVLIEVGPSGVERISTTVNSTNQQVASARFISRLGKAIEKLNKDAYAAGQMED